MNTKVTEIETKIPDTTSFIITLEFIRLAKKVLMPKKEAVKTASKSQEENALNIANKNREKIKKLQTFHFKLV